GNNTTTIEDRVTETKEFISEPSTGERKQVNQHRIQAVNGTRCFCLESHSSLIHRSDHKKQQKGSHPIVAEALPHLGKKQRSQPAGMTKETFVRIHSTKRLTTKRNDGFRFISNGPK